MPAILGADGRDSDWNPSEPRRHCCWALAAVCQMCQVETPKWAHAGKVGCEPRRHRCRALAAVDEETPGRALKQHVLTRAEMAKEEKRDMNSCYVARSRDRAQGLTLHNPKAWSIGIIIILVIIGVL